MRFTKGRNDLDTTALRDRGGLACDPALADPRRSLDADDLPPSADGFVQCRFHRGHFTVAPDEGRCPAPTQMAVDLDGQQPARAYRFTRALDPHQLRITEPCDVLDQACGGLAEHHP